MSVIPKKIYIRHFGTIKEIELTLPKSGLCLVIGHNLTSSGVESIGAGKTLLGEALSRTLLGVRGRYLGTGMGGFSSDLCGNKNTLVRLECDLQGKPLIIWSGYKCSELNPTGEGLRFQFGAGEVIERGDLKETRAELNQLIGVGQTLAESSIHLDGGQLKFGDMSERQLVDLFLSATSAPNWDEAQVRVNQAIAKANQEEAGLTGKRSLCEETINDLETQIKALQEKETQLQANLKKQKEEQSEKISGAETQIKALEKRLKAIQARMVEIKVELKNLEDKRTTQYAALELKLKRTKSDALAVSAEVEEAVGSCQKAESKVESAEEALDELKEPDICPTCGKKWDKKHSTNLLVERQKMLENAKQLLASEEKKLTKAKEKRKKSNDVINGILAEMKLEDLGELTKNFSEEYEGCESDKDDLQMQIKASEARLFHLRQPINDSQIVSTRAQIQAATRSKKESKENLKEVVNKEMEVRAFLTVLQYIYKAFGPSGLSNMMLQDCLVYLNRAAAHLSTVLTGDLVEISFSSTKVLASAAQKPALVIHAKNRTGSKRLIGASKGEGGISNLIIAETLYSLGRLWQKVGYRWLDEAVNSQDKIVRGSVYGYFKEQAKLHKLVTFVVDHSADVESYADSVVLAEKLGAGFTTYRMV